MGHMVGVTQRDIAKEAKVSRSTVAAVLSDSSTIRISEKVRERVLKACQELNYQPHRGAQAVRRGRSNLIAIIYFGSSFEVGLRAAHHLPEAVLAQGYEYLVFDLNWHRGNVDQVVNDIVQMRVEGVICLAAPRDSFTEKHIHILQANRIPVVALDSDDPEPEITSVYCDSSCAFSYFTRHFVEIGCRNLILLVGGNGGKSVSRANIERTTGFREGLAGIAQVSVITDRDYLVKSGELEEGPDLGVKGTIVQIAFGKLGLQYSPMRSCYHFAQKMFAQSLAPDAILCTCDSAAVGVYMAAQEAGVKIPEDLVITGYDGDDLGSYPMFDLTTARQEVRKTCAAAVEVLIRQIKSGQWEGGEISYQPQLILRNSCGRQRSLSLAENRSD